MDNEAIYAQLGRLIESKPDFMSDGVRLSQVELLWLGRVHAIISMFVGPNAASSISSHSGGLAMHTKNRYDHSNAISIILYKALAKAELLVSPASLGAFIPANNVFDALAVLSKIFQTASSDLMIVDPYMDEKALTDFAVLVPANCAIRLLTDGQHMKAGLEPAVRRWSSQYGVSRPLQARKAKARSLHDRLILSNGRDAWVLTQSLNAFAARAPASIVRVDSETAALKVAAYEGIWADSASV